MPSSRHERNGRDGADDVDEPTTSSLTSPPSTAPSTTTTRTTRPDPAGHERERQRGLRCRLGRRRGRRRRLSWRATPSRTAPTPTSPTVASTLGLDASASRRADPRRRRHRRPRHRRPRHRRPRHRTTRRTAAAAGSPSTRTAGLGTWVDVFDWSVTFDRRGDPAASARRHRPHGRRSASAPSTSRPPGATHRSGVLEPDRLQPLIDRAHANGMDVVGWYLPTLDDPAADLARIDRHRRPRRRRHRRRHRVARGRRRGRAQPPARAALGGSAGAPARRGALGHRPAAGRDRGREPRTTGRGSRGPSWPRTTTSGSRWATGPSARPDSGWRDGYLYTATNIDRVRERHRPASTRRRAPDRRHRRARGPDGAHHAEDVAGHACQAAVERGALGAQPLRLPSPTGRRDAVGAVCRGQPPLERLTRRVARAAVDVGDARMIGRPSTKTPRRDRRPGRRSPAGVPVGERAADERAVDWMRRRSCSRSRAVEHVDDVGGEGRARRGCGRRRTGRGRRRRPRPTSVAAARRRCGRRSPWCRCGPSASSGRSAGPARRPGATGARAPAAPARRCGGPGGGRRAAAAGGDRRPGLGGPGRPQEPHAGRRRAPGSRRCRRP